VAGIIASFQADYEQALAWLEESVGLYQTIADSYGLARVQSFLGDCLLDCGEVDAAIPPLEEALAGFRQLDATAWAGLTLFSLAGAASLQQDDEQARVLAEEALHLCRRAEFGSGMAMTFGRLGTQTYEQGDYEAAEHYFREALALRLKLDDRYGMANQLTDLAYVAAARGEVERAARLDGAATALRRLTGANITDVLQADYNRLLASLRDTLGHDRFENVWSFGRGQTAEQVVAAAREIIGDELAKAPSPSS
jgi:non-specific serine/threonine protein kinase